MEADMSIRQDNSGSDDVSGDCLIICRNYFPNNITEASALCRYCFSLSPFFLFFLLLINRRLIDVTNVAFIEKPKICSWLVKLRLLK